MIDTITVILDNKELTFTKGISIEEVVQSLGKEFEFPIIIAKVNHHIRELSYKLMEDCELKLYDLKNKQANSTHISGLTYVLIYAIKELYGKKADISVEHSLDKGIYIKTNFKLTKEKLKEIQEKMKSIINDNLPITKLNIDRLEAIDYFESIGDKTKANVIKYNTDTFITLYRLGNLYNYFYNYMPTKTSQVRDFDLTYIDEEGLVLRFPTIYINDKIKPYEHHPHMFKVFKECHDWAKIMNVETVAELNNSISTSKINDLIKIDETLQSARLLDIAKSINDKKNKIKIVLIAGPSSSGKTTTSRKLCMYLNSFGLNPVVLSMDDYFHDRTDTPVDENGKPDFESLAAIDLKLFDKQIASLLNGEEVNVPTYNFILGKKEYNNKIQITKKDIIVIEGIHGLDKSILTNISRDKKYKIYISPLTQLKIDNHNRISTTDNRLLRRIVRDSRTRGNDVEYTLKTWKDVRMGEEKYIFPFQDEADVTVNTALIYELAVLRTYVEPILYNVPITSPYYEEAKRLLKFLGLFLSIPSDAIPEDSILREFIGKSYFNSL